ncbi:TetR/AcrR family transcriptional regulator C-terminal domain-containing protein [Sorangium sp. So ce176]|uniref:TetR/AcrR family transcriptional regulator C-terminal domain-containing protein n=1 Tax=Sorangium sp. So ce176 TaxID=3133286 RepID=UPI003F5E8DE1
MPVGYATSSALISSEIRHRDGARVFAGTYVAQENTLRVSDTLVGALRDGGLSRRAAAWGCLSIVYYVIGFTLEEQALVVHPGADPAKADPERFREAVERGAYPPPGGGAPAPRERRSRGAVPVRASAPPQGT